MRITRFALVLVPAVFLCTATFSSVAHADPVKCSAAIGKNAAAFAQAKLKLLQKCANNLRQEGLSAIPCPDTKTQEKIDKAETKAEAAIAKTCGGKDKICGTADTGEDTLASIHWDTTATCQNFENSNCTNAIANCADIGNCLTCVGERVVDQAIGLYYDNLNPADPKLQKVLNKCQLAIGKNAAAFFAAKTKALQKCWDTVNKGKATGPCPPFGAGDGKAGTAITKAKTKADAAICKACGGADKACDGVNDVLPADIGFPSDCPPVTAPGTVPVPCTATVTTIAQLRDCVDCVTEFKADCLSIAAATGFANAPAYPSDCNIILPATPTRTATPLPTPTPTLTAGAATPTPTTTAGAATATATATGPAPTATQTPGAGGALCPSRVTFTGTSTNGVLDTGWTGQGHDATVISDGTATVAVTSCAGAAPNCGVCSYVGPIDNAAGELDASRCSNDSSIHCTPGNNAPCGAGTCKFFFGSYLPLAAGGVSTCVENTFNGGITGTANEDTGTSAGTASITSRVFSGPTLSNPCARCLGDATANDGVLGGTCSGGPRDGLTCDRSGTSANASFGPTSLDCPQASGGVIATLPIDLSNTTGSKTRTLSAANPTCRAIGFTTLKCQCDTCNNAAATPCSSNADCTAVGATICGGKRCSGGANNGTACVANSECPGGACNVPGQATAPNQCDDGICSPDPGTPSPNDGICNGGPFEQFCSPVETFRGCLNNGDCPFAGDTCTLGKNRDCFDSGGISEVVTATGNPDPPSGHQSDPTLAALFCIGPTASSAVNGAAGLPGLGRLELTGHATDNGTL